MVGLNQHYDACLLYFAMILILTNVISALIAMAVGAFRFSTSFNNLVGALLALLRAVDGRSLLHPLWRLGCWWRRHSPLTTQPHGNACTRSHPWGLCLPPSPLASNPSPAA
mmetsp:Transcript_31320/g.57027  ORF Transcript_31320/g.57027 Transcript_31320/m.57027 type:complete len:111 (+) Transcript_31320:184-516(+)